MRRIGIVVRWAVAFLLLLTIYSLASIEVIPYSTWNEEVCATITHPDGSVDSFGSNILELTNAGDHVSFTIQLPEDRKVESGCLCFRVYHSMITATYGGTTIYTWGQDEAAAGHMLGCVYPRIDIPDEAWGHELTLTLDVTEDAAFNKINSFEMYTQQDSIGFVLNHGLAFLMVSSACLIVAVLMTGQAIFYGHRDKATLQSLCIASFALLMAGWIFTSNGLDNFFAPSFLWNDVEFLCIYAAALPLTLYVDLQETDPRMHRVLRTYLAFTTVFVVASGVASMTDIAHYPKTLVASHAISCVGCFIVLFSIVRHLREGRASTRYLFMGVVIVVATALFDIFRFNLMKFVPALAGYILPSFLPLGVLMFVAALVVSYYSASEESHEEVAERSYQSRLLQDIVSKVPTGICVAAADGPGTILSANGYFYGLFGYDETSARETGFSTMTFPFDENDVRSLSGRSETTGGEEVGEPAGSSWEYEARAHTRDGRHVDLFIRSHVDDSGSRVVSSLTDVTERDEALRQLKLSEASYRIASEMTDRYIWRYDIAKDDLTCLFDGRRAFGIDQVIHDVTNDESFRKVCSPDVAATLIDLRDEVIAGSTSGTVQFQLQNLEMGSRRWYQLRYSTMGVSEADRIGVGVMTDITDTIELRHTATTDALTGLLTRSAAHEQIEAFLSGRDAKDGGAFVMVDIDDFKHVNDTYGHPFADTVLMDVARIMRETFRDGDVVCRLGGDELSAFVRSTDGNERKVARRVEEALGRMLASKTPSGEMSCSMGVALCPRDGTTYDELYRAADRALYWTKTHGKGGITFLEDIDDS
ncbi:MAG: diguanylate cyclase [Atopobiaceae bacterium]|nr:diguanylate cyclase [Atopobiaceae bacterium]MCI2173965.1 diguanylate cyclase [Atopobiaceae bacterium]MCI2207945.1 diguanylate cyclase [Atopobiaceae bacterium]